MISGVGNKKFKFLMHKNVVYFSNYSTISAFLCIVTALQASQSNGLMRGNHSLTKLHTAHAHAPMTRGHKKTILCITAAKINIFMFTTEHMTTCM